MCAGLAASVMAVGTANSLTRPAAAANTIYTVRDLGTLGGASIGRDINDSGQVVGQSLNTSGEAQAFLWENGRMTNLGTLGGLTSFARGIDDSGRVVGFSRNSNNQVRAFLAQNGNMTSLGTLTGFSSSEAWHTNDSGMVVGRSFDSPARARRFCGRTARSKTSVRPSGLLTVRPGASTTSARLSGKRGVPISRLKLFSTTTTRAR